VIKINKIIFTFLVLLIFTGKGVAEIKDSLFMTVGNNPVTRSDIVNEIKIILILNNESYSDDKREQLQNLAVKSIIKRNVKQIELDRHDYLEYSKEDLKSELERLATKISVDVETLKNICASNELDFSLIENQIKVELYWNSLIFQLYKNRLKVDSKEIDEKLKKIQNKKIQEYLISEILFTITEEDKLDSEIAEMIKKINIEGFENVARNSSISESGIKGGDLGWLNENVISEKMKSTILETPVGQLSKPVVLRNGVLIFKIRDRREVKESLSLEQSKNILVNSEKTKILKMHSASHFDRVRRTITVKFF
tara:strand:- start:6537 stop:7469 length:933 start_codon:yes stop_codon:yes gene_type:complete